MYEDDAPDRDLCVTMRSRCYGCIMMKCGRYLVPYKLYCCHDERWNSSRFFIFLRGTGIGWFKCNSIKNVIVGSSRRSG